MSYWIKEIYEALDKGVKCPVCRKARARFYCDYDSGKYMQVTFQCPHCKALTDQIYPRKTYSEVKKEIGNR